MGQDRLKREGEEKAKSIPKLLKLIFCIWNRRSRSARPMNGVFGHFSVPGQFLGRQARLVPFLPIAILYFENLQLYRLRLGMTGSVALSCRQNNQHEYYLRAVVSPRWTLRERDKPLRATVCFSIVHARPRDLYAKRQMTCSLHVFES